MLDDELGKGIKMIDHEFVGGTSDAHPELCDRCDKHADLHTKTQSLRDKIICLLIYPGARDKSFGDRADDILKAVREHHGK